MKRSRLWRFALLAMAGGMVFQTATPSCQKQVLQEFGTSFATALGPALVNIIVAALQGDTTAQ
jgi:hypothetical protein